MLIYAEFDWKEIYNLQTDEKKDTLSIFIRPIKVKKNYRLLTNTKTSFF